MLVSSATFIGSRNRSLPYWRGAQHHGPAQRCAQQRSTFQGNRLMPRCQGVAANCAQENLEAAGPGQPSGPMEEPLVHLQQTGTAIDPNPSGALPAAAAAVAPPSPAAGGAGAKRTWRTPTLSRKRRSREDEDPPQQDAAAGAGPGSAEVAACAKAEENLPVAEGAALTVGVTMAAAVAMVPQSAAAAASNDGTDVSGQKDQQQQEQEKEQQQQQQQQQAGSRTPSPGAENAAGLTPTQLAQIAANRNRALARRVVVESSAPGAPPLQLSALLVELSWREALAVELQGAGLRQLEAFLRAEWAPGRKPVFPPKESVFQAFNSCSFDKVRVVLLGQDPYHGPGQAMGLSFSVPRTVRPLPPSLINIYKEAAADLGWPDRPEHGDLSAWSAQGVLLLNTCLTVRQGEANSHAKRGWEAFTDAAIRVLSARRKGLVFMLWGNPAQAKAVLVDGRKHHVLKAAHPSPLSASRGFFGCRHFSAANKLLAAQGLEPIEWRPT